MARLVLRNVDRAIIEALKICALCHGRSAEAEHRAILETALRRTRRRSFAEALVAMPDVGRDEDFARMDNSVPPAAVAAKIGVRTRTEQR